MYLNNSINGTGFLTKSTVDALGHIDIVTDRPPGIIGAWFSFDRDGPRGTRTLAELTGNATFFACWVTAALYYS